MAARGEKRKPEAVAGILDRLLKSLDLDRAIDEHRALALWPEAVGPALAAKTRAVSVLRGRLTVEAKSPVWANECRMMSPQIREKLNKKLGADAIKSISFRVGNWS